MSHIEVDVQALDCDFYCFSGHKMFAPTGIGVLFGKAALLNAMPPWQCGGEMIQRVSFEGTTFNRLPFKFEAGTPNIAGAIGLGAAIDFLQQWPHQQRREQEDHLLTIAHQRADRIPALRLISQGEDSVSLLSFNIEGYHASDIGSLLDQQGIAVRTGHHCTMPLMSHLGLDGSLRMSFSFYNTEEEIHRCFDILESIINEPLATEPTITTHSSQRSDSEATTPLSAPSTLPNINELTTRLLAPKGWESRYRLIMQLGKQLPAYPNNERTDTYLVTGCDSTVWVTHTYDNNKLTFYIESNARIIRGLSVILLSYYNEKSPEAIYNSDITELFSNLGLTKHLSPSRGNGLLAINQKIKTIAKGY